MKKFTCSHCGHTGSDVSYHYTYIGGQGDIRVIECDDLTACWKRWDAQHNIRKPELVGAK